MPGLDGNLPPKWSFSGFPAQLAQKCLWQLTQFARTFDHVPYPSLAKKSGGPHGACFNLFVSSPIKYFPPFPPIFSPFRFTQRNSGAIGISQSPGVESDPPLYLSSSLLISIPVRSPQLTRCTQSEGILKHQAENYCPLPGH